MFSKPIHFAAAANHLHLIDAICNKGVNVTEDIVVLKILLTTDTIIFGLLKLQIFDRKDLDVDTSLWCVKKDKTLINHDKVYQFTFSSIKTNPG